MTAIDPASEIPGLLKMVRQRRGQRWTEGPGYATAT